LLQFGLLTLAGFYGVALAASAMMATTAMQLAIDAFGPISDNAGIAEMSELPKEVRTRTDILIRREYDCSNWKGFAIASAANFIGIICSLCDFYRN
jgi:K(+)-stimulated pyrophosphate-energized sodium pump